MSGDTRFDGVDHCYRPFVADIHQFPCFLEIEQRDGGEAEFDHHTFVFGNVVFRFLHDHRFKLVIRVGRRLVVAACHCRAENEVRMESLLHWADREVVIDATVENGDTVFPDRLEK